MAKQLNVNLAFTADTAAAKVQLKDLQKQLLRLASTTKESQQELGFTKQLQEATAAAAQLKVQIDQATNADTGKLDLSKFGQSLKQSGKTLADYQKLLTSLGSAGDKAFASLTDSILNADAPLKRINTRFNELKTTLANTARWQLSSSILHGFMGAVQSAYGYAQDLNESLNNIRIVTGYNIDQMSQFAEEANKAAKALSTTTTDYTNASLIYYQQGLPEEEISKRTEVTIKMANAAGVSAEIVSDQLTAIWNNFYDGSKSLEYYADVLTALGAATASSTDEISDGVEKFAAVADTIGLSYEYAASALATVTAETRQSADVVGTAFRTIFARIQGLNLGETLEDGTTLNKYSQALDKVGISIFESNGQLKQMDDILDEMGSKWGSLNQQQQVALAQTVAGVRQYNQLIALMDKWDVFQGNLNIARGSTGELDKQAKIYAESWEAASKRVRASAEGIYQDLLDDEGFIKLLNIFADIIDQVNNVIDSIGGLKGVLVLVGNVALKVFKDDLANGINNAIHNFKVLTGQAKKEAEDLKRQAVKLTDRMATDTDTNAGLASAEVYNNKRIAQEEFIKNAEHLNETEKLIVQSMLDGLNVLGEQTIRQGELADEAERELSVLSKRARLTAKRLGVNDEDVVNLKEKMRDLGQLDSALTKLKVTTKQAQSSIKDMPEGVVQSTGIITSSFENTFNRASRIIEEIGEKSSEEFIALEGAFKNLKPGADGLFEGTKEDLDNLNTALKNFSEKFNNIISVDMQYDLMNKLGVDEEHAESFDKMADSAYKTGKIVEDAAQKVDTFRNSANEVPKAIDQTNDKLKSFGNTVLNVADTVSSLSMVLVNIQGIMDTALNPDLSGWEKFIAIASNLAMTIGSMAPIITNNIKNVQKAKEAAKEATEAAVKQAVANAAVGQNAAIASGGIAKFGTSIKAFGAALGSANVAILALTAAFTIISAVVANHKKRIEEQTKALEENLEKSKEKVETTQEEINTNNELINNMATLLEEYKENVNVKDQLDSATWELARKYGIEGAAIAELRGDYESYNKVLEEVIKKQQQAQGKQIGQRQRAVDDSEALLLNSVDNELGATQAYQTGKYKYTIFEDDKLLNSLTNSGAEVINELYDSNQTAELILGNTAEEIVNNYDIITKVVEEQQVKIENGNAKVSKTFEQLQRVVETLAPTVEQYRNEINGLAETETSFEAFDIDSYKEFETWLNNSKIRLSEVYKTEDEINQAINNVIDGSFDPAIKEYEKWYRVVQDIKNINEGVAENLDIEKLVDNYGLAAIAAVNWSKVDIKTYKTAIEKAQKYNEAIDQISKAEQQRAAVQELQEKIGSKGITSENIEEIQTAIEWGKEGIISFTDFLAKTAGEQNQYLESLISGSTQSLTNGLTDKLNYAKEQLEAYKEYFKDESVYTNKEEADLLLAAIKRTEGKNYNDITLEDQQLLRDNGITLDRSRDGTVSLRDPDREKVTAIATIEEFELNDQGVTKFQEEIDNLTNTISMEPILKIHTDSSEARAEIQNLLNTEFNIGDSLSWDQINILEKLGVDNLENYLYQMSDGTYQLVGAAEEFNRIVKESIFSRPEQLNDAVKNSVSNVGLSGTDFENIENFFNYQAKNGDSKAARMQVDYLQSTGVDTSSFVDSSGTVINIELLNAAWAEAGKNYQFAAESAAFYAESVDELDSLLEKGSITQKIYNANLTRLREAENEPLDTKQVEDYAEHLMEVAESSDILADSLKDDEKAAEEVSKVTIKLNRGIDKLANGFDDWATIIKKSDSSSLEYAEAMGEIQDALSDVLNVSKDFISNDFVAENLDLIKEASTGSAEAIDALRLAAAQDIVLNVIPEGSLTEGLKNTLLSQLESINSMIPDLEVGATLDLNNDENGFLDACQELINTAGMTVDQANALFDALGFQVNFATEPKKQVQRVPEYVTETVEDGSTTVNTVDAEGNPKTLTFKRTRTRTYQDGVYEAEGYVDAIAMTASQDGRETPVINSMTKTSSGSMSNYSSSNSGGSSSSGGGGGGGGGSTPSKASKVKTTKRSEVVDRYKEINDSLDDLTDALSDANKESDRLYGQARIDNLKKQNSLLQEEIGLIKQKISTAKGYLVTDKAGVNDAASAAGVNFTYDEAGNITNYTAEMNRLYDQLRSAQDSWNASYANATQEEQQDYEENVIKPIEEKIEALKEAVSTYEETREDIEDLENELDDAFYEWQDNNYEILHYAMEIQIEINDLEMEKIDYYLNKISDDFYQLAEAAQLMLDQIPITFDSLGHYENFYNEITAAYAAGEISQADYVEGMKESYSAILDNLSALNDLDKEMLHYYENTLASAADEIAHYTNQLEHLTSVLDHYRSIVELINGEFDYDAIGTILEGQAITRKNELDAATEYYKMLQNQKKDIEASLAAASNDAAREGYQNELKAITEALVDAHEDMLSKTEAWAETMKAVYENTAAEAAHAMEQAFTDGMGFDALNSSLERLSAYQDVYLTKTNQVYETQVLINTAQQAIDKTSNQAAKIRLDNYVKETQALQEKNKLSHLELDIQKAKYELLLAEIALEEAQSAKSTVRLQRDDEGNFGYVYTADQEQVSQAEQDLLDAQNALYNIGLEATNDYGQKLLELQQQLSEDLIALEEERAAGRFATEEEFNAARDQLIQEYNDLFIAYSEQYTTALEVDTAIQEEAWVNAYENMINKTINWGDVVKEYTELCEEAYNNWRQAVETESSVVDAVLNDIESEVNDVTNASNELANTVQGQVIPAIDSELDAVRQMTSAYFEQRQEILALISEYERLADAILEAIRAQAMMSNSNSASSSKDNFDFSVDYSAKAAEIYAQEGASEAYHQALADRDYKISQGYSDYGVSSGQINSYLTGGGSWQQGQFFPDLLKKKHSFATGGYTGEWGPEGRVALVHEKELMLNADDTVNFLDAVNIVRDIARMIDLEALNNQTFINTFASEYGAIGSSGMLEQTVQIEANFPNVVDRTEIEEAFNNLINTASQFANRKKL